MVENLSSMIESEFTFHINRVAIQGYEVCYV